MTVEVTDEKAKMVARLIVDAISDGWGDDEDARVVEEIKPFLEDALMQARAGAIEEAVTAYRQGSGPFTYDYFEEAEAAIRDLLSRPVSEREGEKA